MTVARALITLAVAGLPVAAHAYSQLVVFGDSLSDGGNNALLMGTDPAQVITGNDYMAVRPYASGTYSDGDVWVSFLAASLGLHAAPSVAGGTDYAYGGALTRGDDSVSMLRQVGQYLRTGRSDIGDTLFVLAGGGSSARTAMEEISAGAPPLQTMVRAAHQYAFDVGQMVDLLQGAGARDIVVWNAPDVSVAPAVNARGGAAVELGRILSQAMNDSLAERLAAEANVRTFDLAGLQNAAVADPRRFGLVNVTDACGAVTAACDPATALFWDGIHTTTAANRVIAAQMFELVTTPVPEPSVAWMLALGLAVLHWRRRAAT